MSAPKKPTLAESARADALYNTLRRRGPIRFDGPWFVARRQLGWSVSMTWAAADLLCSRGVARFEADGERPVLILEPPPPLIDTEADEPGAAQPSIEESQ